MLADREKHRIDTAISPCEYPYTVLSVRYSDISKSLKWPDEGWRRHERTIAFYAHRGWWRFRWLRYGCPTV
ncbi:hypothetical protein PCAR4_140029 [Paraburkholderia caribensis]|nr:hypothetical protein PCAR4_140029 [Paraburkholderia caribensis]